jgi:hypothetical protein
MTSAACIRPTGGSERPTGDCTVGRARRQQDEVRFRSFGPALVGEFVLAKARFGSNTAVAAALTLPPLWVRKRYGSEGTRRQILSARQIRFRNRDSPAVALC